MAHDPGADLDQLLAQGRERPMLDLLRQGSVRRKLARFSTTEAASIKDSFPGKKRESLSAASSHITPDWLSRPLAALAR